MDIVHFLQSFGYIGVTSLLIAETGLLIGFFLPGDTLLFAIGILVSQNIFTLPVAIFSIVVGALIGDTLGYIIGRVAGPRVFSRKNSLFFDSAHIETTHEFYKKYGSFAALIGHFFPIVRTAIPTFAGVGHMSFPRFFLYDCVGIAVWTACFVSLGYFFGTSIPNLDRYLEKVLLGLFILSLVPGFIHVLIHKLKSNKAQR
ncbi:MAG: VTT domain-containing protein [Parcubacteria group bacterium]|nr:VTT domain-containing protein [Parcubacteria group bacterium]